MRYAKSLAVAALGGAATIFASHWIQIAAIETEANTCVNELHRGDVEADVVRIQQMVKSRISGERNGLQFVLGDFCVTETEDGTVARCGGFARLVLELGATRGFQGRICHKIVIVSGKFKGHYYALLMRDGRTFEVDMHNIREQE